MPGTRFIDNVNGSDTTGDGLSIGTAYASIARAVQDAVDTSFVFLIADTGVTYVEDPASLPWPRASYNGVSSAGLPDIAALPHITFSGPAAYIFENNGYIKSLWIDGEDQINGLHVQWGGMYHIQYCRISQMLNGSSSFNRTIRVNRVLYSSFDNNEGPGVWLSGGGAHGVLALSNGQEGINAGSCNVTGCFSGLNGGDGITMFGQATLGLWTNCLSLFNQGSGFRINHGSVQIDRCIAQNNAQYGFNCANASGQGYITDCIAYQNTSGALRDATNVGHSGPIISQFFFGSNGTADDLFTGVHNMSVSSPEITLGASPPYSLAMPLTSPAYQFSDIPKALQPFLSLNHGASGLSIGPSTFDLFPTGGGGSPVTRSWWG